MNIKRKSNKRAISPVLATVILIAITLIAAIAIAGFVFGLFGNFTSTAQVSEVTQSLAGATLTGTVSFQNSGTSNANANSMTLTYGGTTCAPAITPPGALVAGTTVSVAVAPGTCALSTAGTAFTGNLALSNGGQVPFSGTFS